MQFRRKMYDRLLSWKNRSDGHSAIFIDGARRVGKSFICEQFAREQYSSHVIIDFGRLPSQVRDIFENDTDDLDAFFLRLATYYRTALHERDTVFVFDEVQLYPRARQLVKYLVADGRYDFIETGSLVTLRKRADETLIPSEEEHVAMFPLDFEEFLWARNDNATVDSLRMFLDARRPLGQALHRRIMRDWRTYMLVGGMPQAVDAFLQTNDFAAADDAKRQILALYRQDVTKFAKGYEARVLTLVDGIPSQLSKKEKTYKLSSLSKSARMREYEDAFVWLADAMVAIPCLNAADPSPMLSASADFTTQKLYLNDTGLLTTLAFYDWPYADNNLYRDVLFDKVGVNEGMLAENAVAQAIRLRHKQLYFYSRVDTTHRENNMEIDFLLPGRRKPFAVEVKSGRVSPHASLDKFMRRFSGRVGEPVILCTKDIEQRDGVLLLPLYCAELL